MSTAGNLNPPKNSNINRSKIINGGCLISVLILLLIMVVSFAVSGYRTVPIEIQGDCEISVKSIPVKITPLIAYEGLSLWDKTNRFWNDTNTFPQSPEITVYRVLTAIQGRQWTHYAWSFEETTKFDTQNLGSGLSGQFTNVQISVIAQDEQVALVQVAASWIPSRIETAYKNVSLFYCQQLVLVYSRKAIGSPDLRLNLSGWFLRDDQVSLIPYNFSEMYLNHIDLISPAGIEIYITPTP